MVETKGNKRRLILKKNIQHLRIIILLFPDKKYFSIISAHPIIPRIIMKGITGKINRSCLFGKNEWNAIKMNVGRKIIRFFFHLMKNPVSKKILTGGIKIPARNKKYVYHELVI